MSLYLKSPIQVFGPEHFSQIFKHISCSTAPVYDNCDNLIGTLSISSAYLHSQSSHTLGLVVAIANAIQKDFQLSEKKALLNVALSANNEAVIVVNRSGIIITANSLAKIFFQEGLERQEIEKILGEQPLIKTVIETGKGIPNATVIITRGRQKFHLNSVQPVANYSCPNIGCVLTLSEVHLPGQITQKSCCEATKFVFSRIVGSSEQTCESITLAQRFSGFDNNVLLQGESGTGKEVYAQSVHNESRPEGPFIAVNCAAIPANLIESELFGYEAGAFTGADRKGKPGKFELANGGTLFLDEIGDMPLGLQAVLLRVLEDKLVMRVGGSRYLPVNFRLVAATNRDLKELVKEKLFREDLYYRLSVFRVDIAPLRQRGADIIELADYFISEIAHARKARRPILSHAARYALLQYHWPGNVRQLQNTIAYAFCMCDGKNIQPNHLPREITGHYAIPEMIASESALVRVSGSESHEGEDENSHSMKEVEKMVLRKALVDTNNHVRAAAKALGISKSTIYRKIKEYEIAT